MGELPLRLRATRNHAQLGISIEEASKHAFVKIRRSSELQDELKNEVENEGDRERRKKEKTASGSGGRGLAAGEAGGLQWEGGGLLVPPRRPSSACRGARAAADAVRADRRHGAGRAEAGPSQ